VKLGEVYCKQGHFRNKDMKSVSVLVPEEFDCMDYEEA
jgi:hypothetical protein